MFPEGAPYVLVRIPYKGHCLFAACDIPADKILFQEFPIIKGNREPLSREAIYTILPKEQKKAFDALSTGVCTCGEVPCQETAVRRRFNTNAYSCHIPLSAADLIQDKPYGAVWEKASRFNHACRPNCAVSVSYNAEIMAYTLRPIKKGEELTTDYVGNDLSHEDTRNALHEQYGFWCDCDACRGLTSRYQSAEEDRIGAAKAASFLKPMFGPPRAKPLEPSLFDLKVQLAEAWALGTEEEWLQRTKKEMDSVMHFGGMSPQTYLATNKGAEWLAKAAVEDYEKWFRKHNNFEVGEDVIRWHMRGRAADLEKKLERLILRVAQRFMPLHQSQ